MTGIPENTAIVAITPGGLALARRLKQSLAGARVHALETRLPDSGADETFADTAAHLRALFQAGVPIIAVCAAGVAIRALAPVLADKSREPPVVALAENGSSAVPLLGGHKGANALARKIAAAFCGTAAVTTAGDLKLGIALDEPPGGWRIANPAAVKIIAAALIGDEPVTLRLDCGDGGWLAESGIPFAAESPLSIRVTDQKVTPSKTELVFHPPVLALGIGCERGAEPEEAVALVGSVLEAAGLSPEAIGCVASLDIKMDEPAVHAVARKLGVPPRFFDAAELEAETPRLANPSDLVFRETGCHGVAEGAALAAAGHDAALVVAKTKSARVTCAVARAPAPLDPIRIGRPRGELAIVGLGPGDEATLTPEARALLGNATDIVGYGLYLDLIGEWARGARHPYALGEEERRCRAALDLAASGRRVALVSSGDAGIYGLASLAVELVASNRAWSRVALSAAPGISAMQAAAARIGAPLGHDFCAISLSDLLTPWPEIERRLTAAGDGDFVVALYNPASMRRRDHIARARDILLRHRAAETPVVLARNLGRPGESVSVVSLGDLAANDVDMLTVVLVGNSRTRTLRHDGKIWVYTPRGYPIGADERLRKART